MGRFLLQTCSICDSRLQPGPGDLPALPSPALQLPGDGITRSRIAAPSPRECLGSPGCSPSLLHPPGFHQESQGWRSSRSSAGWVCCWGSLRWMGRVLLSPITQLGAPKGCCSP